MQEMPRLEQLFNLEKLQGIEETLMPFFQNRTRPMGGMKNRFVFSVIILANEINDYQPINQSIN